jgi:hypothetical protein
MAVAPVSPVTVTGLVLSLVDPLPSWPSALSPQAATLPPLSRARLDWPPAETAVAVPDSPCTGTGTSLLDGPSGVPGLPSWPKVLSRRSSFILRRAAE